MAARLVRVAALGEDVGMETLLPLQPVASPSDLNQEALGYRHGDVIALQPVASPPDLN